MPQTFLNSRQMLDYFQQRFGSVDYRNWQSLRHQFYSYQDFNTAGHSQLVFFGDSLGAGGITLQQTNMPKAGSFGQQHFLLKSIRCKLQIPDPQLGDWDGTSSSTLYTDLINGFVQAGVLRLDIQAKSYIEIPQPFLYAPPADGRIGLYPAGINELTLSDGTPNTLSTYVTAPPYGQLQRAPESQFLVDPMIFIEAEQNFTVKIEWPSGAVPIIGTDVADNSGNQLRVGVSLDGILMRPLQ